MTATPRIHIARSPARLGDGAVYHYAYVRYEVWDEKKRRYQPKPLARLGRTDRLDEGRLDSLGGFLREWLRKDSSLPFEALRERFERLEPSFRILCSRDFGLRFIIEQAWEELGYKEVIEELAGEREAIGRVDLAIFAMVVIQLISPQSKRAMTEWKGIELFFPEGEKLDVSDLYHGMDVLEAGYEAVELKLSDRLRDLGITGTEFCHDTTTAKFRIRYDDEERATIEEERQATGSAQRDAVVNDPALRMRGRSKEKRHDLPQVVVEAVSSEHGLVVHHQTHPGNTSDYTLTADAVRALKKLGYKQVTWAGDAGTNSVSNRNALRDAEFEFVLGEGTARTSTVKEVLKTPGRYLPHPDKPELSFKCVITEALEERTETAAGPQRLYIIRRNTEEAEFTRRRIDRHLKAVRATLKRGGKEAQKLLFHPTYRRYVRRDGRKKDARGRPAGRPIVDCRAVKRMRQLAGKSVIATDCCEAHPVAEDDVYRNLFDIERIFRTLKATVGLGPIRHRKANRIRAHVMIAVMALNLGRWLERKSGMTLHRLQRVFTNLRVQEVEMGGARFWERTELEPCQRQIFNRLGYDVPPKRFTVSVT